MQYFAPQLHPGQHAASLRASRYRRKRKSTHDHDLDDHDHDEQPSSSAGSGPDEPSRSARPDARSHPSFASSELAQLRVAGLLPEDDHLVPPSPFPHAPARVSKPYLGTAKIQKDLAAPPSRLFTVDGAPSHAQDTSSHADAANLRRTHLNVLSTVMHRCLLEADYDRAGRAWGMILRTQAPHGTTVDLRNHGRWAIGAEILLRRKPRLDMSSEDAPNTDHDIFSEQGFELAREYYERLIVQHPTRKQAPHAIDQRSFYPAMFSLWIQEVCEKSKRARKSNAEEARRSRSRSMSVSSSNGKSSTHDAFAQAREQEQAREQDQDQENAIQVEELSRALEIASRLDDLVTSPPFDKQPSLLQLRGNVALWISDLTVAKPTPTTTNSTTAAADEWDIYPLNPSLPPAEQLANFQTCQRELLTAQSYLARVEENGGPRQYQVLRGIEGRLRELRRQRGRLEAGGGDDSIVSMDDGW